MKVMVLMVGFSVFLVMVLMLSESLIEVSFEFGGLCVSRGDIRLSYGDVWLLNLRFVFVLQFNSLGGGDGANKEKDDGGILHF